VLKVTDPATDQVNYELTLTHSGTANKRMLARVLVNMSWRIRCLPTLLSNGYQASCSWVKAGTRLLL